MQMVPKMMNSVCTLDINSECGNSLFSDILALFHTTGVTGDMLSISYVSRIFFFFNSSMALFSFALFFELNLVRLKQTKDVVYLQLITSGMNRQHNLSFV